MGQRSDDWLVEDRRFECCFVVRIDRPEVRNEAAAAGDELSEFDSGVSIPENSSEFESISRNADVSRDCHGIGLGNPPEGCCPDWRTHCSATSASTLITKRRGEYPLALISKAIWYTQGQ